MIRLSFLQQPDEAQIRQITELYRAAGWWGEQGARVYVHPAGARHLADPARLIDSARLVYGDAMDSLWNEWVLSYGPERQREFLTRLGLDNPDWRNLVLILTTIVAVAMTAFTMADDKEKCLAAGCDSYLSKPINPVNFVSQLLALLD